MNKKLISYLLVLSFLFTSCSFVRDSKKQTKINISVISFVKEINEFNRVIIRTERYNIRREIIKIEETRIKYIIYIRLKSEDYVGHKILIYNNKFWVIPIPNLNKNYGIMYIAKK